MISVRDKRADDADSLKALWTDHFGAPIIVARGRKHDPMKLAGFVAEEDGKLVGTVTFLREEDEIEVITLDSTVENRGVGTALLAAVADFAKAQGVWRLCLVTTNDNIRAIRFYQKRGWNLCAFYRDAVAGARKLKPQIPLTSADGIPIRHELEFELKL